MMTSEENGRLILGETNYVWLKEYLAPLREKVEKERELRNVRTQLLELKSENRRLKQTAARESYDDRPAVGFFRRHLPQLFGTPAR